MSFLVLPEPGDRSFARLQRKLRLLALRQALTAPCGPAMARLRPSLTHLARTDSDGILERIGAVSVLPHILLWSLRQGDGEAAAVALERPPQAAPALHPLLPRLHLCLADDNPLALVEDHPDKHGNAVDLGGHDAAAWASTLHAALELIREALPGWWSELPLALERVVPVGFDAERHLSASYREAPGLAYLSLHPDPLVMAEAIVHETQHSKLNTLLWLDPVLDNALDTWTSSPVRPDLRPLLGVLLAAHAFVPVARMHATLADRGLAAGPDFQRRRAEVRSKNREGLDTLERLARPTAIGRRLLLALREEDGRTPA